MMASPQINGTLLKSACYHEPFNIKIGNACCSSSEPIDRIPCLIMSLVPADDEYRSVGVEVVQPQAGI